MRLEALLAAVLALAVVLAWARLLARLRGSPRPRWRLGTLLLLQPLCAALLYLTFVPPELPLESGTMTVLTVGADAGGAGATGGVVVALPEASAPLEAERVPDLATALRRHPGVTRLQVVGGGLDPRDRSAARGLAIVFEPPPLPAGLVALHAPAQVAPGNGFGVTGRVEGLEGGQVRLLDPAGQLVDAADLDASGRFRLRGHARVPGLSTFELRVLDADRGQVEAVPVPLQAVAGPAPRVMLLAGAPNAEFRHLRRWAEDAGLRLDVEVFVGRGVGLGDGPAPATAEAWGEYDLVILDERALGSLGPARRHALSQAVEAGTGVLLQLGGAVPPAARARFADLGMSISDDGGTAEVSFPMVDDPGVLRARLGPGTPDVPFDAGLAGEAPPPLFRREVRPAADDAVPLDPAGAAGPFAWWRAQGRGRIGLWTLLDSHRLALAGRGDLHGELWAGAVSTLARAIDRDRPQIQAMPRADRLMTICGLDASEAGVLAPDGTRASVLPDPAAGPGRCGAYWPRSGGWHLLQLEERAWPFHVTAPGVAPGIAAAALRDATLAMAGEGAPAGHGATAAPVRRGPSWPWFLAWLGTSGLLWWLERRRRRA